MKLNNEERQITLSVLKNSLEEMNNFGDFSSLEDKKVLENVIFKLEEKSSKDNWVICDWGNNIIFDDEFKSFDDAEEHLSEFLEAANLTYDVYRGEYHIVTLEEHEGE